ncbi:MAG: class I SAM-dependent methyltransferase [Proteobacteria bacterium]|nr:class I SAM-dependent methyltransferase [Pseudomonadota bacterium]
MPNFAIPDLQELYSRPYDAADFAWREIGAIDKASNIFAMVEPFRDEITDVLEVGCGTGVVLQKLAERGLGRLLTGIEIAEERVASTVADRAILIVPYDGKTIPFPDASFDLVYATHVLEHVTNPRGFLLELRRVARRFVYVEVPCESTALASHGRMQPTLNIGHINAYSPMSFALQLETSGLSIRRQAIFDSSLAVHAFAGNRLKAAVKMAIRRSLLALGGKLAAGVFSYHCGALCEKGQLLNIA